MEIPCEQWSPNVLPTAKLVVNNKQQQKKKVAEKETITNTTKLVNNKKSKQYSFICDDAQRRAEDTKPFQYRYAAHNTTLYT
mmetsp:Transcript_35986/g.42054  ORF Transcript_35986/g.42054 Transcript_35986/m.42054 type:complete len:82 (-) Transcript_35986:423-668(-)